MRMKTIVFQFAATAALSLFGAHSAPASDTSIEAKVNLISPDGVGGEAGTLTISGTPDGITITPNLHGFTPGPHAFHIHLNPSCDPGMKDGKKVAGLAAGGHYMGMGDAANGMAGMSGSDMKDKDMGMASGAMGPQMKMRGDLPELTANADGTITAPVTKKGLTLAEFRNRSVIVHAYGETPSDPTLPKGGGARFACAVIGK